MNTADTPLADAVPERLDGRRDPLLVDIRERITDGIVTAPEVALERVASIKRDLEKQVGNVGRSDIAVVYGGLLPVPFTFLTGLLPDDESQITVFDWDRIAGRWRELNGEDDGERLASTPLPDALPNEVVLAVSISYNADVEQIERTFDGIPVVHLTLATRTTNGHWSAEKQAALAQTFFDTVKAIEEKGVRRIHLVLAAQNSVVFRFGSTYDRRNLPQLVVYQYERTANPAYPWGVLMPTHGIDKPQIVRRAASLP